MKNCSKELPPSIEEVTATVRRFVHDLNNHLAVISLSLEEIIDGVPVGHSMHDSLSLVLRSAEGGIELNSRLLASISPRRSSDLIRLSDQ
jgi:hypothetical protein